MQCGVLGVETGDWLGQARCIVMAKAKGWTASFSFKTEGRQ